MGFTAVRSTTQELYDGDTVKFDTEIIDYGPDGGVYNPSTGLFVCPVNGLYFVTCTIYLNADYSWVANVEVHRTSGAIEFLAGMNLKHNLGIQTTNQVLFNCNAGDSVGVYQRDYTIREVSGSVDGRPMSVFSAVLIALT